MFQPMLASPGKDVPSGDEWVFEPKYDGIRIIALVKPKAVALMTRNGHDKRRQFPEIAERLTALARKLDRDLVLDGEVVALDEEGGPARFQELQGRMHLNDEAAVSSLASDSPAAFVVFDLLLDDDDILLDEPWEERRARLERVMRGVMASSRKVLRLSEVAEGSPDDMMDEARRQGWEGVMAKRRSGKYEPGRRVRHWQKLKIENRQEFVVAGWTEPRNSRKHFGALLLGYYDDDGKLVYAGHSGGGFSDRQLDEIARKLKAIERPTSPFTTTPVTNERAHWAAPKYVAEVKFNEWTGSGMLRQPIFVGWRDDKNPRDVRRESNPTARRSSGATEKKREGASAQRISGAKEKQRAGATTRSKGSLTAVVEQLRANPNATSATIQIDANTSLDFTSFGKMFFPAAKVTKGRLLEYYVEVAPYLLPALQDRPLVLKRYPNGILNDAFYQQKAPDKAPPGIRIDVVEDDAEAVRRLIGGDLATLLYIVQLGAISTDPWHSRVQSPEEPDYSIVDLDPGPRATFKRVIQVARWVKEELDELGLHGVPKTSGASGMHVALPLPPGATYEISKTLAELVARRVNQKHPKETTVVRAVRSRPEDAIYIDFLQNIRGKTVASVYSARAEPHASVSAPLKWNEITRDLDPRDFTVETLPKRLKRVGDLWAEGMRRLNRFPGIIGDAAA
jgi:bifunctional non-homologous end joining protein LigD